MSHTGQYADGRTYELPADWTPLDREVLIAARDRARSAVSGDDAVDRLTSFYDRNSEYAGTSFLDVVPNPTDSVHAADLYAVSRLSMKISNLQGRLLLDKSEPDGPDARSRTEQLLASIPPEHTIGDLTPALLRAMSYLYHHFRTLLEADVKGSNRWVFAAKLCARKRFQLFPVRDRVVCQHLSGGQPLAGSGKQAHAGRLGWFTNDIQVFAYLATDAEVRESLRALKGKATARGVIVDDQPLRLLDVLLWTRGKG
ncbi:MAG: hypothetical protein K0U84_16060 [Actinomycetia bacterium]|nr:hypothetical protein [Actinomycetes bacterium]